MLIDTLYDGVELHREEKIIYARFLRPHHVLSTCWMAGGLRRDLNYIYNHQSCELAGPAAVQAADVQEENTMQ